VIDDPELAGDSRMMDDKDEGRDRGGRFLPGRSGNPAGREPGTVVAGSQAACAAVLEAFHKVGGVSYLVEVARNDPRTFLSLLGRILPRQVDVKATREIEIMFGRGGAPGQAAAHEAVALARERRALSGSEHGEDEAQG